MTEWEAIKRFEPIVDNEAYTDSYQDACKLAINALEKQIPIPVLVKDRHYYKNYFCPVCKKQQKDTYKNRREGCYCERCGQKLRWGEEE